jgi:hypothetical protein
MLLYIEKHHDYSYEFISEEIPNLFNDLMYHLVSCKDEMHEHEIELYKNQERCSFSIECSCGHVFKHYDDMQVRDLEDEDKEVILKFVQDIETPEMREVIYEKREMFLITRQKMEAVKSPTFFDLEF